MDINVAVLTAKLAFMISTAANWFGAEYMPSRQALLHNHALHLAPAQITHCLGGPAPWRISAPATLTPTGIYSILILACCTEYRSRIFLLAMPNSYLIIISTYGQLVDVFVAPSQGFKNVCGDLI